LAGAPQSCTALIQSQHGDAQEFGAELRTSRPSIVWALCRGFGGPMLVGACFKLMQDLLAFVSPLVLKQMICFTKWDDIDLYYGYLYAVILLVVAVLQSFFLHQVRSDHRRQSSHVAPCTPG
jgi:hypothetical protein